MIFIRLYLCLKVIIASQLIKHCLATEAVIRKLVHRLGEDEEIWGLAGLLHDLDYEKTKEEPQKHTLLTAEIL